MKGGTWTPDAPKLFVNPARLVNRDLALAVFLGLLLLLCRLPLFNGILPWYIDDVVDVVRVKANEEGDVLLELERAV